MFQIGLLKALQSSMIKKMSFEKLLILLVLRYRTVIQIFMGVKKQKQKKNEKTIFSVAVGNKQTKTRYVCNFFYQFLLNSSKKNSSAGEFFVGTIFDPLEERC